MHAWRPPENLTSDSSRRPRQASLGRVIVLGASVGGLLAARILSEFAQHVTVLERDDLSVPGDRPGVPQGKHVHALLARGQRIFEDLFPGITEEWLDDGAVSVEALAEIRMALKRKTFAQGNAGYRLVQASRALLEWRIRQRVRVLANVTVQDRTSVLGLCLDASSRVVGVRIFNQDATQESLSADLVVSCLGRFGPILDWLREAGFDAPEEEGTAIDMLYASRQLKLPSGSPGGDKEIICADQEAGRAMALFEIEGGHHLLTLIGYGEHRPPTDDEGFWTFASTVVPRDVAAALVNAIPLSEVSTYRYLANLRRRYERLHRFPEGLLVLGDAVCSFSPAFGQGMTMSAIQAEQLRLVLGEGTHQLASRYFSAAARAVDDAWLITRLFDQSMPHVAAPWYQRFVDPLLDVALSAATHSPCVAVQAARVMGMLDRPVDSLKPDVVLGFAGGLLSTVTASFPRLIGNRQHDGFDPAPELAGRGFFALKVTDVTPLTRESVAITFCVPAEQQSLFEFSAGQHITIRGLNNGKAIRRTYSISEPQGSGRLTIAVKRQADGVFSNYAVKSLRAGECLQVSTPGGVMLANALTPGCRCAAVVAGSGIVPLMSIITTTLQRDPSIMWLLHFANENVETIMFRRELDALTKLYRGRLQVFHYLSRHGKPGQGLTVHPGRLDPSCLSATEADEWFCCGPAEFVISVTDHLRQQALPSQRLHVELFTAAATTVPKEKTGVDCRVVISGAGPDLALSVNSDDIIMNAALAVREDLPYGCLGGACGSCIAQVTKGAVKMRNVPFMALTPEDKAAGKVLLCLASPSTPDVHLALV